ncbi:hypothetical protein GUITHDRAFT_117873 [Guillardia theta CCMP2712]|uniref:Uncharacterized protein n=1 Tax=Guillardia theta (strain CCMP2712) TaxID=905079 RepID=L1IIN3_GUITC|nr:hypothetical protein GUITHDRAFT_117873 [Guillardia theta CCMP2712]EKX35957.1 hypothetical protein GUITHDRAFT_117873 [Guillardia theta CCMP2712]|eukprot:XP_005822937.1 hypothetical protein GUITHDRAFT_117873 [Guillardia theta CCMP2712]
MKVAICYKREIDCMIKVREMAGIIITSDSNSSADKQSKVCKEIRKSFNSWRESKNKPVEAIEVESEEEAERMRKERLSMGIYEACLMHQMLGTDRLIKAGHPRMFFLITASMCAGFAIRGESKLIDDARIPYHVKGQPK